MTQRTSTDPPIAEEPRSNSMHEPLPGVLVSDRSRLREPLAVGRNVIFYGDVEVGAGSVIEDNVVIGHPSPSAAKAAGDLGRHEGLVGLNEMYDFLSTAPTVIGPSARVRSNTVIYAGTTIGARFECAHNVVVREDCELDADVYLFAGTVVKSGVRIGRGARISNTVGNRTQIGHAASMLGYTVHAYTAGVGGLEEPAPTIQVGATVSRGAVIVGDVTVGEYALVAANAVVVDDVPAGAVVAGVPAKPIRDRTPAELAPVHARLSELGIDA
jgi:acetyltransferase-like isoleucine patch superfamily enzyme